MQYEEAQFFRDSRAAADPPALRGEIAQLDVKISLWDRQNGMKHGEILRLKDERQLLWRSSRDTPQAAAIFESERKRIDNEIAMREREITANLEGKNWSLDQRALLEHMIAERQPGAGSAVPQDVISSTPQRQTQREVVSAPSSGPRSRAVADIIRSRDESVDLARGLYATPPAQRSGSGPSSGAAGLDPRQAALVESLEQNAAQLSEQAQNGLARFQRARLSHFRGKDAREKERAAIKKSFKRTAFLVVFFMLYTAAVCDLLSIIDLGWLVSWMIPIISWFMVRRINGIMKSSGRIIKATNRLNGEAAAARKRVANLLPAAERARLLASERVSKIADTATSYVSTWIRDSVITQLVELIPGVDILPLYLGQVVKMIIEQNIEYQKVQQLMPAYEKALASLDKYEIMEIEQLVRRLTALIGQRDAVAASAEAESSAPRGGRRPAANTQPLQPRPAQARPAFPALSPAAAY